MDKKSKSKPKSNIEKPPKIDGSFDDVLKVSVPKKKDDKKILNSITPHFRVFR